MAITKLEAQEKNRVFELNFDKFELFRDYLLEAVSEKVRDYLNVSSMPTALLANLINEDVQEKFSPISEGSAFRMGLTDIASIVLFCQNYSLTSKFGKNTINLYMHSGNGSFELNRSRLSYGEIPSEDFLDNLRYEFKSYLRDNRDGRKSCPFHFSPKRSEFVNDFYDFFQQDFFPRYWAQFDDKVEGFVRDKKKLELYNLGKIKLLDSKAL